MIYVSTVLGGPELDGCSLDELLGRIVRAKPQWAVRHVKPSLEVVFYLPGSKFRPDFAGARTGRYSRKLDRLMVQVSVATAHSESPNPVRFAMSSLREAVQMASAYFERRRRTFPAVEYGEMLDRLDRLLGDGPQ